MLYENGDSEELSTHDVIRDGLLSLGWLDPLQALPADSDSHPSPGAASAAGDHHLSATLSAAVLLADVGQLGSCLVGVKQLLHAWAIHFLCSTCQACLIMRCGLLPSVTTHVHISHHVPYHVLTASANEAHEAQHMLSYSSKNTS